MNADDGRDDNDGVACYRRRWGQCLICEQTLYLSRTLYVEQKCSHSVLFWGLFFSLFGAQNLYEFYTWSSAMLLHIRKLLVVSSNFVMWTNDKWLLIQKFFHVTNLQCVLSCCDLLCFDAKSILSQFMLFSVEQKLRDKSCPWSRNDKYDVTCVSVTSSEMHCLLTRLTNYQ